MGLGVASSSRASSLIRTWFTSDMLIKTLPLPAALPRSCLLRTQSLLHFRFSLRIPAEPPEPAHLGGLARRLEPLHPHPPPLPPRLLPKPRRPLLPPQPL